VEPDYIENKTNNIPFTLGKSCQNISQMVCLFYVFIWLVRFRAHSFPRQNLTNSAANLVNSAAHRGKADEISLITADTQLSFRGLIKSW